MRHIPVSGQSSSRWHFRSQLKEMEAALNLEGDDFSNLFEQVRSALDMGLYASVVNPDEFNNIPNDFMEDVTAVLGSVFGDGGFHPNVLQAIAVLLYRKVTSFGRTLSFESFTQGRNPILVDSTGLMNRMDHLEQAVVQLQQGQEQLQQGQEQFQQGQEQLQQGMQQLQQALQNIQAMLAPH